MIDPAINELVSFHPGDVVETTYGVGVVVARPSENNDGEEASLFYRVLLWRVPGRSIGTSSIASLRRDALLKRLPAAPGMVTTKKSSSLSSSQETVTANAETETENGENAENNPQKYMVQAYYSDRQVYRIIAVGNKKKKETEADSTTYGDSDENVIDATTTKRLSRLSIVSNVANFGTDPSLSAVPEEVSADDLAESAPCAKFYPLLVQLMERGNKAASTTQNFIADNYNRDEVKELTKQVTGVAKQATPYLKEQTQKMGSKLNEVKSNATTASSDPEAQAKKLKDAVSDSGDKIALKVKQTAETKEVKQLMEMLKTEDLTVLLERGKERLEQLVQEDIPTKTRTALEKAGVIIADDDDDDLDLDDEGNNKKNLYKKTLVKSRKAALSAMQKVLDQANLNPNDVQAIQDSLGENFGSMLDSWTEVAKTDRTLSGLLDTVNEQTAAWQEATGRLLNTRSAGIFLDGASRIQERAKSLFSKDQLQWAGEIGSKFTKAFTEGDAAVARLKSIELGDSVRNRLVAAIEVRSESLGGLDGIIAGALTAVNQNVGGVADKVAGGVQKHSNNNDGDQIQKMLTNLQSRATTVTADTNETLISILARQSQYRDVALLKVEQVMCDLESQFGQDLSPEDIAAIAQGEGGTAKLFNPIAKRAAKEIEKQLDNAESSVTDPTILEVLQNVRKIVSGDLTVDAVLDQVVNVLNDDKVVAVGENLVKHGEQVLDAIEGVNANKVVDDAMKIAEKAGITKDTVMEGIEGINVNELLDNAGNALTDEKVRQKLLSDATDTALDFILKVLPSMPVPPVEGVKDGLVYKISNLSMEGFKVRKENILVKVAGMQATKKARVEIEEIDESIDADAPAWLKQPAADVGRTRPDINSSSGSFDSMDYDTTIDESVVINATELLIIDVSEISALMNDVNWSFEQTYMPYLKGSGKFDVNMSGGDIRLVFELRKRPKKSENSDEVEWEPVLCLHDRSCSIGSVEFNMQGGSRMAWVINKVASVFKGLLRDYVVRTIMRILTEKSGWILSKLNQGLSPFWDVLLRTAKLNLADLEIATKNSIVEGSDEADDSLIELVWREHLPLGMNLLLNDESGQLKVVDFPRGSQARTVCEGRNLDPDGFKGSRIVAVNGIRYQNEEDLFESLRDPGRPKTIQFELAESDDAERIRKFVEESGALDNPNKDNKPTVSADVRDISVRNVEFVDDMDLGIEFANSPDNAGLVVRKFLESSDGLVLAAERKKGKINVGDLLTHVNGKLVIGENGSGRSLALKLIEAEGKQRPLSLTFADPYLHSIVYEHSERLPFVIGGPIEVLLKEDKENKRILLDGFKEVDSVSEKTGVLLGDYIVFVNGISVGAGCRWMGEISAPSLQEVDEMLRDKSNYPIGLTFARPQRQAEQARDWTSTILGAAPEKAIEMESAETICVSAECYEQLGLDLEIKSYSDVVVKDLRAITGPLQSATQRLRDPQTDTYSHLSIDAINDEFVPSFATPNLVKSAMERSWKSENRVQVTYCDDDKKMFILNLKDQ